MINPSAIQPQTSCEKAVLGSLILDAEQYQVWKQYAGMVKNPKFDLFHSDKNRTILDGIVELYEKGIHPGMVELTDWLLETNRLESAGGPGYILALPTSVF